MANSKWQFFKNGVSNQKRADITIDLKRPDISELRKWTVEQKKNLPSFLKEATETFDAFMRAIQSELTDEEVKELNP